MEEGVTEAAVNTATSKVVMDNSWPVKIDINQYCRACANPSDCLVEIFETEGIRHELALKVNKYLPIKVSEEDKLPKSLCYNCASTLISWNNLVINCIQAEKKLTALVKSDSNGVSEDEFCENQSMDFADHDIEDVCGNTNSNETQKQNFPIEYKTTQAPDSTALLKSTVSESNVKCEDELPRVSNIDICETPVALTVITSCSNLLQSESSEPSTSTVNNEVTPTTETPEVATRLHRLGDESLLDITKNLESYHLNIQSNQDIIDNGNNSNFGISDVNELCDYINNFPESEMYHKQTNFRLNLFKPKLHFSINRNKYLVVRIKVAGFVQFVGSYFCCICSELLDEENLLNHYFKVHKNFNKNDRCQFCSHQETDFKHLKRHLVAHAVILKIFHRNNEEWKILDERLFMKCEFGYFINLICHDYHNNQPDSKITHIYKLHRRLYQCIYCGSLLKNDQGLYRHKCIKNILSVASDDLLMFLCSKCKFIFTDVIILTEHIKVCLKDIKIVEEESTLCNVCESIIKETNMQSNIQKINFNNKEIIDNCDKTLLNENIKKVDEQVHDNTIQINSHINGNSGYEKQIVLHKKTCRFFCVDCKVYFSTCHYYEKHTKLVHSGAALYKCDNCHTIFRTAKGFKTHTEIHCGKRSNKYESINANALEIQGKQSFLLNINLKAHTETVSKSQNCNFQLCNEESNELTDVNFNLKHFNEISNTALDGNNNCTLSRTINCSVCNENFDSDEKLNKHVNEKHLEKYTCTFCKKKYASIADFKAHLVEQHNIL
ncbi:uncharacterized protein LOC142324868 isoform X2 [Lycorma delicatula]